MISTLIYVNTFRGKYPFPDRLPPHLFNACDDVSIQDYRAYSSPCSPHFSCSRRTRRFSIGVPGLGRTSDVLRSLRQEVDAPKWHLERQPRLQCFEFFCMPFATLASHGGTMAMRIDAPVVFGAILWMKSNDAPRHAPPCARFSIRIARNRCECARRYW